MVPAGDIAREVGYTPDYITRLAREKKVKGKKVGKKWMVDPISVYELVQRKQEEKEVRSKALRRERKREQYFYSKSTTQIEDVKTTPSVSRASIKEHVVRVVPRYFDIGAVAKSTHAVIATSGIMLAGVMFGVIAYATPVTSSDVLSRERVMDTLAFIGVIGDEVSEKGKMVAGTFSGIVSEKLSDTFPQSNSYVANAFWSDVWCGFKSLVGKECFFDFEREEPTVIVENDIEVTPVVEEPTTDRVIQPEVVVTSPVVSASVTPVTNPVAIYTYELPDIFPAKWLDQVTSKEVHIVQTGGNMRSIEDLANGVFERFDENAQHFTTKQLTVNGDAIIEGNLTVDNFVATSTITTYSSIETPFITATSTNATSTFAGGLAIETTGFVYDFATNRIGIGTDAPETRLTLVQESDALGGGFRVNQASDSDYFEMAGIADRIALGLNGTELFSFTESGNFGIGTTSPFARLGVAGDAYVDGNITVTNLTATSTVSTPYFVATDANATSTFAGGLTLDGNGFVYDFATNHLGLNTSNTQSLLTLGNTTSIISTDTLDGADNKRIQIGGGGGTDITRGAFISLMGNEYGGEAGDLSFYAGDSGVTNQGALRFFTGNILERLTIAANGNVGIGTTTPAQNLSVAGNGYVTGGFGIGVATTTPGALQTSGNGWIGGDLVVVGDSTVFGDSATLGESSADTLVINSSIGSDLIPTINATYDIGSPSFFWDNGYFDTITANNISAASSSISGTQSQTFTLNSDNASADTEGIDLIFYRGTVVPNALISWNAILDKFDINQPLYIQNDSPTTTIRTLDVWGTAGQTADIFRVASSSGDSLFTVRPNGKVGIGNASPENLNDVADTLVIGSGTGDQGLTIYSNAAESGYIAFNDTGNTSNQGYIEYNHATNYLGFGVNNSTEAMRIAANGNVGIGTTSPFARLGVAGDAYVDGNITVTNLTATSTVSTPYFVVTDANATSTFAGGLAIETTGFVYDFATNRIGIGTDAPETRLTLVQESDALGGGFRVNQASDSDYFEMAGIADRIALGLNGTELFSFTESGNFGIGTTSPFARLGVAGDAYVDGTLTASTLVATSSISVPAFEAEYATTTTFAITSLTQGRVPFVGSGGLLLDSASFTFDGTSLISPVLSASSSTATSTFAGGLAIETTGFVYDFATNRIGIGTASPATQLHIYNGTASTATRVQTALANGTAVLQLINDARQFDVAVRGDNGDSFIVRDQTAGVDRFVITSAGNVGIGTTTPISTFSVESSDSTVSRFSGTGDYGLAAFLNNAGQEWQIGTDIGEDFVIRDRSAGAGTGRLIIEEGTDATGITLQADNDFIVNAGNVGIGTTNPLVQLHLEGTAGTDARLRLGQAASGGSAWDFISATNALHGVADGTLILRDHSNAANRMVINASGNVGIGETNPTHDLEVEGGDGVAFNFSDTAGGAYTVFDQTSDNPYMQFYRWTGVGSLFDGYQIRSAGSASSLIFSRSNSAAIGAETLTDVMALDNNGNVGIGTTTPSRKLTVQESTGSATVASLLNTASESSFISFKGTTGTNDYDVRAGAITADTFGIYTANTERVRVDSSGRLGVGTTSPFGRLSSYTSTTVTPAIVARQDGLGDILQLWDGAESAFIVSGNNGAAGFGTSTPAARVAIEDNFSVLPLLLVNQLGTSDIFQLQDSGSTVFTVQDGGYVGIGTASPNTGRKLTILNSTTGDAGMVQFDNPAATNGRYSLMVSGTAGTLPDGTVGLRNDATGQFPFVVSNTGSVGIGTTSPSANFHVSSGTTDLVGIFESTDDVAQLRVKDNDTAAVILAQDSAVQFGQSTTLNGSGVVVRGNGFVGIGITNPDVKLHVWNGSAGSITAQTGSVIVGENNSDAFLNLLSPSTNAVGVVFGDESDADAGGIYYPHTTNQLQFRTNGNSTKMVIDSSGNVGIGNVAPDTLLDIGDDFGSKAVGRGITLSADGAHANLRFVVDAADDATDPFITFTTQGGNNFVVGVDNNALGTGTSGDVLFLGHDGAGTPDSTTGINITAAGNVGIGTTGPSSKLHVYNATANVGARIETDLTDGTAVFSLLNDARQFDIAVRGDNSDSLIIRDQTSGLDRFAITSAGNVGVGTTNPDKNLVINAGAGSAFIKLTNNTAGDTGNNGLELLHDGTNAYVMNREAGFLSFRTSDSERLRIDASGNVGVGTASIDEKLHIETSTGSARIKVENTGANSIAGLVLQNDAQRYDVQIQGSDGDKFTVYDNTSAAHRLTIDTSGNVGIGTVNPNGRLSVKSSGAGNVSFYLEHASNTNQIFQVYQDASDSAGVVEIQTNAGADAIKLDANGASFFDGGAVGIGTTSPSSLFHVQGGTSLFYGDGSAVLDWGNTSSLGRLTYSGSNPVVTALSGDLIIARTSGLAETARFTSNGRLGIGVTSPNRPLQVNGTGSTYIQVTNNTTGSGTGDGLILGVDSSGNSLAIAQENNLLFGTAGVEKMRIDTSGNVGIGTTTPDTKLDVWTTGPTAAITISNRATFSIRDSTGQTRGVLGTSGSTWGTAGDDVWLRNAASGNLIHIGNSTPLFTFNLLNGQMGIGTTDPATKLEINDTNLTTAVNAPVGILLQKSGVALSDGQYTPGINFYEDDDNDFTHAAVAGVADSGGLGLAFFTHDDDFPAIIQERMRISETGNIGIGTTTPVSTLSIQGSLCVRDTGSCGTTAGTIYATNAAVTDIDLAENYPTIDVSIEAGEIVTLDPYNNEYIKRASYGDAPFGIISTAPGLLLGGEDALGKPVALKGRVPVKINLEGGDIAIGDRIALSMTEPGVGMKATESIRTIGIALEAYTASSTADSIMVAVENEYTFVPNEFALKSENTGFGTTSPYAKLSVVNDGVGPSFIVEDSTGGDTTPFIVDAGGKVGIGTSTPTAQLHTTGSVRFENFGAGALQTDANGNLTVSSDERLKDIEGSFDRGLEEIRTLEPIMYRWNEFSGFERETVYAGFSAQNVQDSIPEAVGEDKYGFLTLADRPILAAAVNAIKELDLDLQTLASEETLFSEADPDSFLGGFLGGLRQWFADAANGIGDMIAGTFKATEQLCINDTCVSEEQLQQLLNGGGTTPVVPAEDPEPEEEEEPVSNGGGGSTTGTTTDETATSTDSGSAETATSTEEVIEDPEETATSTEEVSSEEENTDEEVVEEASVEEEVAEEEPVVEEAPEPEPEPEPEPTPEPEPEA